MRRHRLLVSWILLAAATAAFASGLVLLVAYHMHHATRPTVLGLGRGPWLWLHRIAALGTLAGAAAHVVLNLRPLLARLRRGPACEVILYLAFAASVLAGHISWLLGGTHGWIDLHFVAGMVALPLAAHHTLHRRRSFRGARPQGGGIIPGRY